MTPPVQTTVPEAKFRIRDQIRINATEAGELVRRISVTAPQRHSDGFVTWTGFYPPGPPGTALALTVFPAVAISRRRLPGIVSPNMIAGALSARFPRIIHRALSVPLFI